jgi:hypothetical protein
MQTAAPWRMTSNRASESDLFGLPRPGRSSSSAPVSSSPVTGHESGEALSSRHVLPRDLDAAIKHLDDRKLERLILAVLQERERRKLPVSEKIERKLQTEMATRVLPQGKLNAIRAAFKAGVPRSRIAQQFGVSRSDVQTALAGYGKTR